MPDSVGVPADALLDTSLTEREAVLQVIDGAFDEIARICEGRWHGTGDWRTSIPARPEWDSDLILGDALRIARSHVESLVAEVERLGARQDETLREICNLLPKGSPEHDAAHSTRLADSPVGVVHLLRQHLERLGALLETARKDREALATLCDNNDAEVAALGERLERCEEKVRVSENAHRDDLQRDHETLVEWQRRTKALRTALAILRGAGQCCENASVGKPCDATCVAYAALFPNGAAPDATEPR